MAKGQTDPQSGQGKRLGQGAQNHQLGIAGQQRQGGVVGKIHIRLVNHEQPRGLSGQRLELLHRREIAERRIRVGDKDELGPALDQGLERQGKILGPGHTHGPAVLHGHQNIVQAIGRDRIGDPVARVDAGAHQHGQQVVRAVADQDLIRLQAVHLGRLAPHVFGAGTRIDAQLSAGGIVTDRPLQGAHDVGRGRIGILVGIELDVAVQLAGLLAGHISLHVSNSGADDMKKTRKWEPRHRLFLYPTSKSKRRDADGSPVIVRLDAPVGACVAAPTVGRSGVPPASSDAAEIAENALTTVIDVSAYNS